DAGRQRQPARVDALACSAEVLADGDDAAVGDGDAAGARGPTEAVDHRGMLDHEVVHGHAPRQPRSSGFGRFISKMSCTWMCTMRRSTRLARPTGTMRSSAARR